MRAPAAAALLLAAVQILGCGSGRERPGPPAEEPESEKGAPADSEADSSALPRKVVKLYFPSSGSDTLVAEDREIYDTGGAVDRAKQILSELLAGPSGGGALPAVPAGTTLRQVYLGSDGTGYADFSTELRDGLDGGSSEELLAVYSIVNSVLLNVPEMKKLAILVDGRARATLAGHIDLRKPLVPDRTLLKDKGQAPATPAEHEADEESEESTVVRARLGSGEAA